MATPDALGALPTFQMEHFEVICGGFSDAGHDRIWDSSGDAGDVKVQAICL
jgi:hypothetical protein